MPIAQDRVELHTLMTEGEDMGRDPSNEDDDLQGPSASARRLLAISFFLFGLINNGWQAIILDYKI